MPNNSAQRTTSVYREEIRKKEANGTFSSFLPPQCGPFWSGSRLLMINPAAHGKIGTFTMEGVVLASEYRRATCLGFPCSPARSPWEPVAAVHGQIKHEKKTLLLNHYRAWNYSESAGNVQTDKPRRGGVGIRHAAGGGKFSHENEGARVTSAPGVKGSVNSVKSGCV